MIFMLQAVEALNRANFDEGLTAYRRSVELARRSRDPELIAWTCAKLGTLLVDEGDAAGGWQLLAESLRQLPQITAPRRAFLVLSNAVVSAEHLRLDGAVWTLSERLLDATASWKSSAGRLFGHSRRAASLRRYAAGEARRELALARAELTQITDAARREAQAAELDLIEGEIDQQAQPAASVAALTRGLTFLERRGNVFRTPSVLLSRGKAYQASGQPAQAEADWQRGVSLVLKQEASIGRPATRIARLDAVWPLFDALVGAQRSNATASLNTAELARAREFEASIGLRGKALDLAAFQAHLPADEVVVVYSVLPTQTFIWTVSHDAVALEVRPIANSELDARVDEFVQDLQRGQPATAGLSTLLLPQSIRRHPTAHTTFVADGPLARLPFAALTTDDGRYLVEQTVLRLAPSLGSLVAFDATPWSSSLGPPIVIAVSNAQTTFGLPALPGVDAELAALRQIYGGSMRALAGTAATREAVLDSVREGGLVHFAGHAVLSPGIPEQSRLLLRPSPPEAVSAADIASTRLRPGALVVLGACRTGAGRAYRGEGLMNLARPFLVAGASGVVAALWDVDDRAEVGLASSFHRLLRDHQPAIALALAQRQSIARRDPPAVWANLAYSGGFNQREKR